MSYKMFFILFIIIGISFIFYNAYTKTLMEKTSLQQSHTVDFDDALQAAMVKQQKLQENNFRVQKENYINSLKEKYGTEVFEEKLAVCELFTNLYVNNRTKENEKKYIEACDPMYH